MTTLAPRWIISALLAGLVAGYIAYRIARRLIARAVSRAYRDGAAHGYLAGMAQAGGSWPSCECCTRPATGTIGFARSIGDRFIGLRTCDACHGRVVATATTRGRA